MLKAGIRCRIAATMSSWQRAVASLPASFYGYHECGPCSLIKQLRTLALWVCIESLVCKLFVKDV